MNRLGEGGERDLGGCLLTVDGGCSARCVEAGQHVRRGGLGALATVHIVETLGAAGLHSVVTSSVPSGTVRASPLVA